MVSFFFQIFSISRINKVDLWFKLFLSVLSSGSSKYDHFHTHIMFFSPLNATDKVIQPGNCFGCSSLQLAVGQNAWDLDIYRICFMWVIWCQNYTEITFSPLLFNTHTNNAPAQLTRPGKLRIREDGYQQVLQITCDKFTAMFQFIRCSEGCKLFGLQLTRHWI